MIPAASFGVFGTGMRHDGGADGGGQDGRGGPGCARPAPAQTPCGLRRLVGQDPQEQRVVAVLGLGLDRGLIELEAGRPDKLAIAPSRRDG